MSVAEVFNVFREVAKEEDVVSTNFTSDFNLSKLDICFRSENKLLTFAPSQVPMMRPPLSTNFMFEVPEASVPAVEICSLISEAGVMISALLTL